MYYRLHSDYVLRGWRGRAWSLIKRPENRVRTLRQEEFQALLLCDGMTDIGTGHIADGTQKLLCKYEEEGIVEACADEKSLEEEQFYRYYDNRFVRSVFWSVTGRCNFRCRHCYMDAPQETLGELSHEQAVNLIDQMAQCGVQCVDLTGGEPFVRRDFWSLIDRIQLHKIAIGQIYTNGWRLDEGILHQFEERDMRPEFSISFDGTGWHDWMRGIEGAEEAALRALRLCAEHGFPTSVEMCVHRGNREALARTAGLLADIGVSRLRIGNVMETDLWRRKSDGNAMTFREYLETMLDYIPQFYEMGMPMDITLAGMIQLRKGSAEFLVIPERHDRTEDSGNRFLCGAARYACYITPEGRLLPCMPMTSCKNQDVFPLVQDIGLKKGLSDSFYMDIVGSRVRDLLAVNSKCAACEHKYQCGGGCRAFALEQTGDLMGCDNNQCILWNEGYVERIRETAEAAIAKYCKT